MLNPSIAYCAAVQWSVGSPLIQITSYRITGDYWLIKTVFCIKYIRVCFLWIGFACRVDLLGGLGLNGFLRFVETHSLSVDIVYAEV